MEDKLRIVKKRIEEVEEGNRELSLSFERVNMSIKEEELKGAEFEAHHARLYRLFPWLLG